MGPLVLVSRRAVSQRRGGAGHACADGYHLAKPQGKPNPPAGPQSAPDGHFFDFTAAPRQSAFTFDSSRYLNCPSNLIGMIPATSRQWR
jgi:hypothetical protein